MKFSKLIGQAERLVETHQQGNSVGSEELSELQRRLTAKISRYQAKLEEVEDPQKREKLQTRLKVVSAQLKKSKQLSVR
ncbi:MAG: hypothetical protein GY785_09045 [Gammaproteobacteria bacterium]|nr:hypothetical protein [Gammaproteobacteria bacterium]